MDIPPYVLSSIPFVSHSGENVLNRTFIKVFQMFIQTLYLKYLSHQAVELCDLDLMRACYKSLADISDMYYRHVIESMHNEPCT